MGSLIGRAPNQVPTNQMLGRLAFLDEIDLSKQNLIWNPLFRGNSRNLTGSIVLAAGARGHDCWKAGAAGCSYSVTNGVATITAGTLIYTIDGQAITSGPYTLSHAGTAPARIDAGPYFTGTQTALEVRGTPTALEFGVGTIVDPQFEIGTAPTPFAVPGPEIERTALNWYVQRVFVFPGDGNARPWAIPRSSAVAVMPEIVVQSMRAIPSLTMQNSNSFEYLAVGGSWTATTVSFTRYGATSSSRIYADCPIDNSTGGSLYVRRNAVGDVFAILSAEL